MRQFMTSHPTDGSMARIAYRVSRSGEHPILHGVWWPRSTDLSAELPAVIEALDSRGFLTESISFAHENWTTVGQHLLVAGRIIRLGPFRSIDPRMVSLSAHDGRARIDLLVVPPGTYPLRAERAFARVLDWDQRITAANVLTSASTAPAPFDEIGHDVPTGSQIMAS